MRNFNLESSKQCIHFNLTFFTQFDVLKAIGGANGRGDGNKILEPVVHSLISPTFLSSISWTGRGKKNEKKIALSLYENAVNLISFTLNKADSHFNHLKTVNNLKYKIIKYAQSKFGERPTSSASNDDAGSSSPISSASR